MRYPYLECMAEAASETLRQSVPEYERAVDSLHPSVDHIDTNLQQRIRDVARELLGGNHAVGLQMCVICRGETIANVAAGTLGTANPRPVTPWSLFNVFSVSKAVLATGVLVMLEDKGISVDEPIAKYWPEFGESHPDKKLITIRHALSHQSGLANAFPDNVSIDLLTDWDQMKDFIAGSDAVPAHKPGEETHYHYLSFAWILGGFIEEVTGRPYEKFIQEHLLGPLGLSDEIHIGGIPEYIEMEQLAILTTRSLKPPGAESPANAKKERGPEVNKQAAKRPQLAKFQGRQQLMNPSVFNMRKVRAAKLPSANGHASAHALASLMNFVISQSNSTAAILSSRALEEARTPQKSFSLGGSSAMLDNPGASFGLGFQTHAIALPDGRIVRSIGHSGFGGSTVIGFPEMCLTIAFTTNQLSFKSVARTRLLEVVFRELGLQPPKSLVES